MVSSGVVQIGRQVGHGHLVIGQVHVLVESLRTVFAPPTGGDKRRVLADIFVRIKQPSGFVHVLLTLAHGLPAKRTDDVVGGWLDDFHEEGLTVTSIEQTSAF